LRDSDTTHEEQAVPAEIKFPDGETDVDDDEHTDLAETGNQDEGESSEEWEDEDHDKP